MAARQAGVWKLAWGFIACALMGGAAASLRAEVGAPCSGGEADVVLTAQTLGSGDSTTCTGVSTATVGPALYLQDGSTTMILSPSITVIGEIDVREGATLALGNLNIVPIRKTGQTECWHLDGSDDPTCSNAGQDGDLQKGVAWPNPRFTDHGDGTVTDNLTDLVWMQAPECGARYDDPIDTTWATAMTDANAMASGQCGLTDGSLVGDWGLPNARELESLLDFGVTALAIPDTAGTGQWSEGDAFSGLHATVFGYADTYWASTPYSGRSDLVWCTGLHEGQSFLACTNGTSAYRYVWMVRGESDDMTPAPIVRTGQTNSIHVGDDGAKQRGVPWPEPRFTDNLNGTITDNLHGLVWLKNADCTYLGGNWTGALSDANSMYDGHPLKDCGLSDGSMAGEWRLPNILELRSLIHHAYNNRAIPDTVGTGQWAEGDPFTGITEGCYWTSTTHVFDTSRAWNIAPKYGDHVNYPKSTSCYVWPVRDPQ